MTDRDWVPSQAAKRRLRQFGYTNGQINDLLSAYLSTSYHLPGNQTDDGFCRFCLKNQGVSFSLRPSSSWQPGSTAIATITEKSIPEHVWKEYLEHFLSAQGNKKTLASWDAQFVQYADGKWDADNRNPAATTSFMTMDWHPDASTVKDLLTSQRNLDILVAEYRLYWCERGERKPCWSRHFFWWAQTQLAKNHWWLRDDDDASHPPTELPSPA